MPALVKSNPFPPKDFSQSVIDETPEDEVTLLGKRVSTQSRVIREHSLSIAQLKLQETQGKEELSKTIASLEQELAAKSARIQELEAGNYRLEQRLCAVEALVPRLSAVEAKVNDRTWRDQVNERLTVLETKIECAATKQDLDDTKKAVNGEVVALRMGVEVAVQQFSDHLHQTDANMKLRLESTFADAMGVMKELEHGFNVRIDDLHSMFHSVMCHTARVSAE